MELPERLKLARTRRGMTQREAGEAAGVGLNSIWRYEVGRIRPSVLALRGLAAIYETSLSWLLGDEGDGGDEDGSDGTQRPTPVDVESAKGRDANYAESILLLSALGQELSDESLRSISDFIRYLHEREASGRENGRSATPSAIQSQRPSNTAHPDGRVNV